MSKSSGLGDAFYLGGYDLSGDTGAIGEAGGGMTGTQDVTGLRKEAFERIGLLRDGRMNWTSFFNPAAAAAHEVLSSLPTSDRTMTYCRGEQLGSAAACMIGKQVDYAPSRGNDGTLTVAVSSVANGYGLEWGQLLTAGLRTDTAAADGAQLDGGSASSFGLQAYLHVFDLTGTNATVTLEESADGSTWTPLTGGGFTQVTTAPAAQRIQTARDQAVARYLRATSSGTFSALTFAVVVCRNPVEVEF